MARKKDTTSRPRRSAKNGIPGRTKLRKRLCGDHGRLVQSRDAAIVDALRLAVALMYVGEEKSGGGLSAARRIAIGIPGTADVARLARTAHLSAGVVGEHAARVVRDAEEFSAMEKRS